MLSARELTEFRSLQIDAMPDVCTIQRSTKVRSGLDYTVVWADVATNVPCRITEQGDVGREFEQAGSVVGSSDLILRLPYGTDVTNADRVISNGTTYDVTRVLVRSNATVTTALIGVTK
jgi:SPP1 family predicted phage head-tail adaptor